MKSIGLVMVAAMLLVSTVFFLAPANAGQKTDPTSAAAWSGGNNAGNGTFMSYCMPCHGAEGKGDGMLSEDLDVKPRDLSNPLFMSTKTDKHLFKVIKHGGASVGLTENMTPFEGQLSDKEINNVIAFLRKDICGCTFK